MCYSHQVNGVTFLELRKKVSKSDFTTLARRSRTVDAQIANYTTLAKYTWEGDEK